VAENMLTPDNCLLSIKKPSNPTDAEKYAGERLPVERGQQRWHGAAWLTAADTQALSLLLSLCVSQVLENLKFTKIHHQILRPFSLREQPWLYINLI
jgi:hypothetical protein